MKCKFPVAVERQINGQLFRFQRRCNQCMACRITRSQERAARMELEASLHSPMSNHFLTLTYSEDAVPRSASGRLTLRKADWLAFRLALRKRLRAAGLNDSVRYSVVGEYGDRTQRPHFHVLLFGLNPLWVPFEERNPVWAARWRDFVRNQVRRGDAVPPELCGFLQLLHSAWAWKGHVHVGNAGQGSALYAAGYVTKKLTRPEDLPDGDDREPEFGSWSTGLGKGAVAWMAEAFRSAGLYFGEIPSTRSAPDDVAVPVQKVVRRNGRKMLLDRFLQSKLIDALGGDSRTDEEKFARFEAEYAARFLEFDEGLGRVDLMVDDEAAEAGRLENEVRRRLRAAGSRRVL